MAWITENHLTKTGTLWARYYGRPVDENEAREILMNVRRLVLALVNTRREDTT